MNNTEELKHSVENIIKKQCGEKQTMASEILYEKCGGFNTTGLSLDKFRMFVDENCSKIIQSLQEPGNENSSPSYCLLSDQTSDKEAPLLKPRSASHSGSAPGSHDVTPETKKFNPKTDGYNTFYYSLRRLSNSSRDGNVLWSDLRAAYKKTTGRHLTTEELNAMCGTENLSRHNLLTSKMDSIVETLDTKGLLIRPTLRTKISPSPPGSAASKSPMNELSNGSPYDRLLNSGNVSPTALNNGNGDLIEDAAKAEKRREILRQLQKRGITLSADGRHVSSDGGSAGGSLDDSITTAIAPSESMSEEIDEDNVFHAHGNNDMEVDSDNYEDNEVPPAAFEVSVESEQVLEDVHEEPAIEQVNMEYDVMPISAELEAELAKMQSGVVNDKSYSPRSCDSFEEEERTQRDRKYIQQLNAAVYRIEDGQMMRNAAGLEDMIFPSDTSLSLSRKKNSSPKSDCSSDVIQEEDESMDINEDVKYMNESEVSIDVSMNKSNNKMEFTHEITLLERKDSSTNEREAIVTPGMSPILNDDSLRCIDGVRLPGSPYRSGNGSFDSVDPSSAGRASTSFEVNPSEVAVPSRDSTVYWTAEDDQQGSNQGSATGSGDSSFTRIFSPEGEAVQKEGKETPSKDNSELNVSFCEDKETPQKKMSTSSTDTAVELNEEDQNIANMMDSTETVGESVITVVERVQLKKDLDDDSEESSIPYDDNITQKSDDEEEEPKPKTVIVEAIIEPQLKECATWEKDLVAHSSSQNSFPESESEKGTEQAAREFLREVAELEPITGTNVQPKEDDHIETLSPKRELSTQPLGIPVSQNCSPSDDNKKSKKRVRLVTPKRRIFNCCTVL